MRIGVNLGPTGDWSVMLAAAQEADVSGFDSVGFLLKNAASTPLPPTLPRVVVGCDGSRRLIRNAIGYADEINVYADEDLICFARHEIEVSHRAVTLSVFVWDWPEDIAGKLAAWAKLGVQRTFLTFWHPFDQLAHATKFMP